MADLILHRDRWILRRWLQLSLTCTFYYGFRMSWCGAAALFIIISFRYSVKKKDAAARCKKKRKRKGKPIEGISQSFLMFSFSRRYMCAVWWRLKHLPSCWQHLTKKRKKKKWVKSKDRKWKRIQGNNGCHVICKKGANIQAQTGRKSVRTLYTLLLPTGTGHLMQHQQLFFGEMLIVFHHHTP